MIITEKERIESVFFKINKTEKCWLWTGAKVRGGYGKIRINYLYIPVHRYVWELSYGSIPTGNFVLHKCDIANCVRPNHLFLGNQKDNMQDMLLKGRNPRVKLTQDQINNIRKIYGPGVGRGYRGKLSQCELAKKYGIARAYISQIVNFK